MKKMFLLGSILANVSANSLCDFQGRTSLDSEESKKAGRKSKYNLTKEQLEQMDEMSFKQKKVFLKSISKES